MYRIVIADDEVPVRELIANCINRSDLPMEVVASAQDGEEALRLIREHRPDLLLTDVCMPVMDGLELIQEAQKIEENIRSVVISGYDDFAYARRAMELGVTNYLLKPFSTEELFTVLEKMQQESRHKKILVQNMEEMKQQIESNRAALQEHFLKTLLEEGGDPVRQRRKAEELHINLDYPSLAVGIVKILPGSRDAVERLLLSAKDDYFDRTVFTYGLRLEHGRVAIVFCGTGRNRLGFFGQVEKGIQRLNRSLKKYYGLHLVCALGGLCTDMMQLDQSYREAVKVFQSIRSEREFLVAFREQGGSEQKYEADINETEKQISRWKEELVMQVRMGESDRALETFEQLLNIYEKAAETVLEYRNFSFFELAFSIDRGLQEIGVHMEKWENADLHEAMKAQLLYGNLLEIRTFMKQFILQASAAFGKNKKNKSQKLVETMEDLIEQHLADEAFCLESAAGILFFSSNYLRRIFRQIKGESFSDYLIRRRMESAAYQLKEENKKIQEVADSCGYSNQRYFASAFKKYYGVTPTEYRNDRR